MPDTMTPEPLAEADAWSALMAAAQRGDRAAYRRLLLAVAPYVRAMAAQAFRSPADVEDTVQDVLLTLHQTRHLYDPARPFRPWLAGIARHRIIDRLRRQGRRAARETRFAPQHESVAAPQATQAGDGVDARALRAAIASLPVGQRRAVELLKLRELSLLEAATLTGMTVGALKVATHRALRRLRQVLGGPGHAA